MLTRGTEQWLKVCYGLGSYPISKLHWPSVLSCEQDTQSYIHALNQHLPLLISDQQSVASHSKRIISMYQIAQPADMDLGPPSYLECSEFACSANLFRCNDVQFNIWTDDGLSAWVDWSLHCSNATTGALDVWRVIELFKNLGSKINY